MAVITLMFVITVLIIEINIFLSFDILFDFKIYKKLNAMYISELYFSNNKYLLYYYLL